MIASLLCWRLQLRGRREQDKFPIWKREAKGLTMEEAGKHQYRIWGGLYVVHEYEHPPELPTRSMNFSQLLIQITKDMYLGTRKFCFVFKAVLFFPKLFLSVSENICF